MTFGTARTCGHVTTTTLLAVARMEPGSSIHVCIYLLGHSLTMTKFPDARQSIIELFALRRTAVGSSSPADSVN